MTITRKLVFPKAEFNAEINKERADSDTAQLKTNELAIGILTSREYLKDQYATFFKKRHLLYNPRDAKNLQLFAAISEHDLPKVILLLGEVNINEQDHEGDTFLHAAVQEGHRDIVELLVKQGANVTIQNKKFETPLDLANKLKHTHPDKQEIVDLVQPKVLNLKQIPQSSVSHHILQSSLLAPQSYSASGLKHSLHGNVYQLKLLMLFMHRGIAKGYNFRLSTEWDAAEKFDDLVFEYSEQGRVKYRFLQAKHKQDDNEKITIGDLFTTSKKGEFNLEKYFISYLRIKKNSNFQNSDLEDFVICTNIGFDLSDTVQDQLKVMTSGKNKDKKIFMEIIHSNDVFFKDGGTRYKLKNDNDLVSHLKQGGEVQKEIQGQNLNIDAEVDGFLEKLVFAANQPNEIELGKVITQEIGAKFNLIDVDLVTDHFLKEMLDWMKKKEGNFLSCEDGRQFFEFARQKVDKIKISGPTLGYVQSLKHFDIVFKKNVQIDFLNNQKQILHFVPLQRTKLSAIKINQFLNQYSSYQNEDSYIFLSLEGLLRLQSGVLNAFKAENTGNLLIIECKNQINDIQKLYSDLKSIIDNNSNKKIILIAEDGNILAHLFKIDYQNRYQKENDEPINDLSDLTLQSQNRVLKKIVHFQEAEISLHDLLASGQRSIVAKEVLFKLVDDNEIKIGKAAPELAKADRECYIERAFSLEGGFHREITDEIAIITAKPGMGKSLVLTHLAETTKKHTPSLWVAKINLIEHTQKLREWIDGKIERNFIVFLSKLMGINTSLEKALFQNSLNRLAVFFDGFDEISPTYQNEVMRLFMALKEAHIKKMYIATRLHMRDILESGLGVSSYELNPLTSNEQKELLKKIFRRGLEGGGSIDERRLDVCTQQLLDAFVNIAVMDKEFISVPLQLNMLAKTVLDRFQEFYNDYSQDQFTLPDNFNSANLYEEFVKYKYDVYKKQRLGDTTRPEMLDMMASQYEIRLKDLQLLALYTLFKANANYKSDNEDLSILPIALQDVDFEKEDMSSILFQMDRVDYRFFKGDMDEFFETKDINCIFSSQELKRINALIREIEDGRDYFGIIGSISEKTLIFVHPTFAEYLAAQKIVSMLETQPKNKILLRFLKKLLSQGVEGIQFFFDSAVIKSEQYPLHAAISNKDIIKVKDILNQRKVAIDTSDMFGRTALHLAVIYSCNDIIEILTQQGIDVNSKDKMLQTPLSYALALYDLEIVNLLLHKKANLPSTLQEEAVINAWFIVKVIRKEHKALLNIFIDKYGYDELSKCIKPFKLSLVGVAAKYNKKNIIEYFINKGLCGVNDRSNILNRKTLLHYAALWNNFDLIKFLLRNHADINARTIRQCRPIDLAIQGSKTHLLLDNMDNLRLFLESASNKDLLNILHSMKNDGALDLVEKVTNSKGMAIFHYAVSANYEQVVKYLTNNGMNVNIQDGYGRTPLHYAVEDRNVAMVQFLTVRANLNVKDYKNRTPLHYAVMSQYLDVVKLLLDKGANPNAFDKLGKTPLHDAVMTQCPSLIKLLLDSGASPNTLDNQGKAALHYVITYRGFELTRQKMVEFLKEGNADINVKKKIDRRTPLHDAVMHDDSVMVDLLLKNGANPSIRDKWGKAPLHYANNNKIITRLIQADPDRKIHDYDYNTPLFNDKSESSVKRRRIEIQLYQQKAFIEIEQDLKSRFPSAEVRSVKQGLYLPSFAQRNMKINGKCAVITRGFSQSLFLGQHHEFLNNLETSAELYERLASGKQISAREKQRIFSFSSILDHFEEQVNIFASSLPSSLSPIKSHKTWDDLTHYIKTIKGDFAIHLSTNNHVVAVYRIGGLYSYFDSNMVAVSNLKKPDQLMKVVDKNMKMAGYEVLKEGFLVEHFDVAKANSVLSAEQQQALTSPLQTERCLLSLQDQNLGPIDFKGKKLHRKTLYDMGAKLYEGSVPTLIHSQMENKDLIKNLRAGKIKITAREYLQKLKGKEGESIREIVQATSVFSKEHFEGSIAEKKNADAIRELVVSEGQKLNSYELNKILNTLMEGSIKTIPYYLEVARARYNHPTRLVNAVGRISMFRGAHATLHALQQGDMVEVFLGSGEMSFSLFSQLIEDKVVKLAPKLIKQMKFGIYVTRGFGGLISSPFDIADLVRSSIDLSKAEKNSKEWRDAIASITFSSASVASGIVFAAAGTVGAGTVFGFAIVLSQGVYNGISMVHEFKKYRLTAGENAHLFFNTFFFQPIPESVGYVAARKDMVKLIIYQGWQAVLTNHKVVAYATGLGSADVITHQVNCRNRVQGRLGTASQLVCDESKEYISKAGHAVIDMLKLQSMHRFSRMVPYNPGVDYRLLCVPECPQDDEKYGQDCKYGVNYETHRSEMIEYYCENAAVIGHASRIEHKRNRDEGEGKVVFDLKLVNSGIVRASQGWSNEFIIANGTERIYGGNYVFNQFILTEARFKGVIFGGENATNILDTSSLVADHTFYDRGNITIVKEKSNYTLTTHKMHHFIGKKERIDKINCDDQENIFIDCKGGKNDEHDIITNCKQVVIYRDTEVNCNNDGDYTFYVKPEVGKANVRINRGRVLIHFTETDLLEDCHNITYSLEENVLTLEIKLSTRQKFILNISNFFNKKKNEVNAILIDKYGSAIELLINKDRIDAFILRAETKIEPFNKNISDWYKSCYQNKKGYQIYSIVKNLKKGMRRPYSIFGSAKSDVISLKDAGFAKGGEGGDVYSLFTEDIQEGPNFIEIDNKATDKKLDILHIQTILKETKVEGCDLKLFLSPNTSIQIKDYFFHDEYRHLVLMNNKGEMLIVLPKEGEKSCNRTVDGTWKVSDIQLVQAMPFYSATDKQSFYSIPKEQTGSIVINAHLNNISLYRNYDNLLVVEDNTHGNKSLIVNLQGFYRKKNNTLYFYPDNYRLNLTEAARLAVNYQKLEESVYEDSFKEYSVDLKGASTSIDHALEAPKTGILLLQNSTPENIGITASNNDLVLSDSNHTLVLKDWDVPQNRIAVLKFGADLEITGLDKFNTSQATEIIFQINKADLMRVIEQKLKELNNKVLKGVLYLLIARNTENGVAGAHKCLGFDSVMEQQSFIVSYQPYYNATTLKQVLYDDNLNEPVKALVWLVAKGCLLSSDKKLLVQCFSFLMRPDLIESLHATCLNSNINTFNILKSIGVLIRDFKQDFKKKITENLDESQKQIGRSPRKRRFVGQPQKELSSLSGYVSWITNGISNLFLNNTTNALSSLNQTNEVIEKVIVEEAKIKNNTPLKTVDKQVDVNAVLLLDVISAKLSKRKLYASRTEESISLAEAQARASGIFIEFNRVLNKIAVNSGILAKCLNLDPITIQSTLTRQILNGSHSKIVATLYKAGEKACPPCKQKDKFLDRLKSHFGLLNNTR